MKKYILPLILIICLILSSNALTTAWDISTATYAFLSKSVGSQEALPRGLAFSPDGTKMYTVGTSSDTVFQYALSTPWAVNTADYADKSKYVGSEDPNPQSVTFKPDGTKMYVSSQWSSYVQEYTLDPAWAVNTAIHVYSKDIYAQDEYLNCTIFKPDGTKMYTVGSDNDRVYQYTLSTAWTVSTAVYDDISVYVGSQDTNPLSLFFSSDGSYFYIVGTTYDRAFQYALSTPWAVNTAVYDEKSKYVADQATAPQGLAFKPDGSKMYVQGIASKTVFQYTLPVGWDHKWNTKEISKWNTKEIIKWNGLE